MSAALASPSPFGPPRAPEIPETLRLEAIVHKLPEHLIAHEWSKYCAWVYERTPGANVGGLGWTKWVLRQVKTLTEIVQAPGREERARIAAVTSQREAAQRKAAEDAEYAKEAMSFPEFVVYLQTELELGVTLPPHEHALAAGGLPPRSADPGVWMLTLLAGPPGAPKRPRLAVCACGEPTEKWTELGRVYASGRCPRCQRESRAKGNPPSLPQ